MAELPCEFGSDGLYTARGVLTDLAADTLGAARSTALIRTKGTDTWQALALRTEGASGKDFVWRRGMRTAQRDRNREALRTITNDEPADVADRLVFRYVLCGPDRAHAGDMVRHVIARVNADGSTAIARTLPPEALDLGGFGAGASKSFCTEAAVALPPDSLTPGRYVFAVSKTEAAADRGPRRRPRRDTAAAPASLLNQVSFTVQTHK